MAGKPLMHILGGGTDEMIGQFKANEFFFAVQNAPDREDQDSFLDFKKVAHL